MQVTAPFSSEDVFNQDLSKVPTEQLKKEIVHYAGIIAAATCRWLLMLAEFDRREAWRSWDCISAAQWLSWQCGLDPDTAREHIRVGRALAQLPKICEAFSQGLLSYSKVRALTRTATAETEETLLEIARHTTAAQTERIAKAHRRGRNLADLEDVIGVHQKRFLRYHQAEDGSFVVSMKLTADEGARVVVALERAQVLARKRLKAGEFEWRSDDPTGEAWDPTSAGLADAFLQLCESAMTSELATRAGGDRQQVVVLADLETISEAKDCGRCEVQGVGSIPAETARRIACDCSRVGVLLDKGRLVTVGRKSRSTPVWMRRALHARDGGCRFPGCDQKVFLEAHHIIHWINQGETSLENLLELCWFHHWLVHEGRCSVHKVENGRVIFQRKDGSPVQPENRDPISTEELEQWLREDGAKVDPRASVPTLSADGPMDLKYIVSGLLELELKLLEGLAGR